MDKTNIAFKAHEIWHSLNEDAGNLTQEQKEMEFFQKLAEKIVENHIEPKLNNAKLSKEDIIEVIRDSNLLSSYVRQQLFNN